MSGVSRQLKKHSTLIDPSLAKDVKDILEQVKNITTQQDKQNNRPHHYVWH